MTDKQCRVAIFFGVFLWFWLGGGFASGEYNIVKWSEHSRAGLVFVTPILAIWLAIIPIKLGNKP